MTYLDPEAAEKELRRLAKKYAPELKIVRAETHDGQNQIGAEIIRVTIVYSNRTKDDAEFDQQRFVIADEFHEWVLKQGDVRFPHFSFRSKQSDALVQKEMLKNA